MLVNTGLLTSPKKLNLIYGSLKPFLRIFFATHDFAKLKVALNFK